MNAAAENVMRELPDITIAYGISDEYRWASPAYRTTVQDADGCEVLCCTGVAHSLSEELGMNAPCHHGEFRLEEMNEISMERGDEN